MDGAEAVRKSRAKDKGIVVESQKFFKVIKGIGVTVGLIIIVVLFTFMISRRILAPTPVSVQAQVVVMPLCAGGNFDFSRSAVPADLKIDFRPDCVTAVTLPPRAVFRTDSSEDVKIIFIDGSTYLDGPGHQVWYGLKKGVFRMHGITNAGIMKITLDKKT